jgi:hypothetical protein
MNLFLRAKHWQLFILIIGIPLLLNLASELPDFNKSHNNIDFNNDEYFMWGTTFFLVVLMGWIYSVTVGLQRMLPATIKMKVMVFKIFLLIPLVYSTFLSVFFDSFSKSFGDPFFGAGAFIIIPIHLFSMFCMFYCLYFMAKTIKTVELQRAVTFGDFFIEFLLIWFFPIGIWILQPRINRLVRYHRQNIDSLQ